MPTTNQIHPLLGVLGTCLPILPGLSCRNKVCYLCFSFCVLMPSPSSTHPIICRANHVTLSGFDFAPIRHTRTPGNTPKKHGPRRESLPGNAGGNASLLEALCAGAGDAGAGACGGVGGCGHSRAVSASPGACPRCVDQRVSPIASVLHDVLRPAAVLGFAPQTGPAARRPPPARHALGPGILCPGRCGCARFCAPCRSRRPAALRVPDPTRKALAPRARSPRAV